MGLEGRHRTKLTEREDGYGAKDFRLGHSQLLHCIWQRTEMVLVRVREKHNVNLGSDASGR